MTEALEWVQCNGCGRRHRWTAERAGTKFACGCGHQVYCPEGASSDQSLGLSDTMLEDIDSPTAAAPDAADFGFELPSVKSPKAAYKPLIGAEALRAERSMIVWSVWLFVGLFMVVHAIILYEQVKTNLLVQIYTGLAVLIFPLALFKWNRARRRWQRGGKFIEALHASLRRFDSEEDDAGSA